MYGTFSMQNKLYMCLSSLIFYAYMCKEQILYKYLFMYLFYMKIYKYYFLVVLHYEFHLNTFLSFLLMSGMILILLQFGYKSDIYAFSFTLFIY